VLSSSAGKQRCRTELKQSVLGCARNKKQDSAILAAGQINLSDGGSGLTVNITHNPAGKDVCGQLDVVEILSNKHENENEA